MGFKTQYSSTPLLQYPWPHAHGTGLIIRLESYEIDFAERAPARNDLSSSAALANPFNG
jgi:hypothetical protein